MGGINYTERQSARCSHKVTPSVSPFDPNRPLHTLESGSLVRPRPGLCSDKANSKVTHLRYLSVRGMLDRKARVGFPELQEKGSARLSVIMVSAALHPVTVAAWSYV